MCHCSGCLYSRLEKLIKKEIRKVMSEITDSSAATLAALAQIGTSLDNVAADEANLAKQIQDLKDQIGGGLSPDDKKALQSVLDAATAMAARTKSIADAVPDLPAPPPPPNAG